MARPAQREVRILHVSDTHNCHWQIEDHYPMPDADVLVHTGDFTDRGTRAEIASFVGWLHTISERYTEMIVIPGNHDWWNVYERLSQGQLSADEVVRPGFFEAFLRDAAGCVPENLHVLDHSEIAIYDYRIFGSGWCPWHPGRSTSAVSSAPLFDAWKALSGSTKMHRFGEIPEDIDMLLTHGPAKDIMDCMGHPGRGWGSSESLKRHIYRARPRMHLFGHLHEQRGEWRRQAGQQGGHVYGGGIEFRQQAGALPFPTTGPPPGDYPCELISCNAMLNHEGIDRLPPHIAGPARLIVLRPRTPPVIATDAMELEPLQAPPAPQLPQAGADVESAELVQILSMSKQRRLSSTDAWQVCVEEGGDSTWQLICCPHEEGCVYIVHAGLHAFLDTHGTAVSVWNNSGRSVPRVIAENTSRYAGNLRWRLLQCPHEPGTLYIVNTRHGKFLDACGGSVQVWNGGQRSIEEVIANNTSRHARNLRWKVLRADSPR